MKMYKGKPLIFTNPHAELFYEAGGYAALTELVRTMKSWKLNPDWTTEYREGYEDAVGDIIALIDKEINDTGD